MNISIEKLTVFYENPFWVGVFEQFSNGQLSVCKITFGAEPKDSEVWAFILRHYNELEFSPTLTASIRKSADSPKRRQRNARKQVQTSGIGTKAQQALQKQREEIKTERKQKNRHRQEEYRQRQFEAKQQKRKEKHKGH